MHFSVNVAVEMPSALKVGGAAAPSAPCSYAYAHAVQILGTNLAYLSSINIIHSVESEEISPDSF